MILSATVVAPNEIPQDLSKKPRCGWDTTWAIRTFCHAFYLDSNSNSFEAHACKVLNSIGLDVP